MRRFRAILARENTETDEGMLTRVFPAGAFEWGDGPWTLTVHHDQTFILGRVDSIERLGDLIIGYGVLDDEGEGDDAARRRDLIRQVEQRIINSVSLEPCGLDTSEECGAFDDDGMCMQVRLVFNRYRVGAASVVTVPGIEGTLIEIDATEPEASAASGVQVADIAVPNTVPDEWLLEPADLPDIDSPAGRVPQLDGARVFGYLCSWQDCHISFPTHCQTPWHSVSGYAYAMVCGPFPTAAGEQVKLAPLAVQGGHYPTQGAYGRQWREAQAHYDDPTACAAYVAVGENEHGVWFSGMLRSGVTQEQLNLLTRHQLSGDWRTPNGSKELVGMCSVNIPGFVRQVAMVASGADMDVVAAVVTRAPTQAPASEPHACSCGGQTAGLHPTVNIFGPDPALAETRLAYLEASVNMLADVFEPDIRERLRERLR